MAQAFALSQCFCSCIIIILKIVVNLLLSLENMFLLFNNLPKLILFDLLLIYPIISLIIC